MDFNQQQYQSNYNVYLESNPLGAIGGYTPEYRANLLSKYLLKGRRIFEIGAGSGMDAEKLRDLGYEVIPSDYVEKFVEILNEKGFKAVQFDATKDEIPDDVDAVYANAVFVHLSEQIITDFLKRIHNKLNNEKLIFISLIKGEGSERSARARGFERDFYYYNLDEITKILNSNGFEIIYSDEQDPKWLQLIAQAK